MDAHPSPRPARLRRELSLILLLALSVRLLRLIAFTDVVEIEGSEYGRIAQNLAQHGRYVGLIEGPELMLPPLYPLAIAACARATDGDVVLAGRLVSMIAGLLTVTACWLLALRSGGPRAARWTGLIAALLPAWVLTSAAVFSEGLLLAWLGFGLLAFERAADSRRILPALACGAAFGAAYLTRIESVLIAPVAVFLLARGGARTDEPGRRPWLAAGACLMAFVLVAAPYPLWVREVTGQTTFAGKSARVFATIERFSRDLSFDAASYALSDDGQPEGPWLTPNAPWDGPGPLQIVGQAPGPILVYLCGNGLRAASILLTGKGVLSVAWLVPIWIAWRRRRDGCATGATKLDIMLAWVFLYVLGMACVYKVLIRYLVPLAIPAAIWAGRGLSRLEQTRSPRAAALLFSLLILSSSRGFVSGHAEFDETRTDPNEAVLEVAGFLEEHASADTIVFADDSRIPFHAGTLWRPTPLTDSVEALITYAKATGARFLVATTHDSTARRPGSWLSIDDEVPGLERIAVTRNGRYALFTFE